MIRDSETGEVLDNEQAQEMIRESIARTGRFLLESDLPVRIGDVEEFAGLPFRIVRFVSREEYEFDWMSVADIWGERESCDDCNFFFEVEVAD